jgi:hypothetical protein
MKETPSLLIEVHTNKLPWEYPPLEISHLLSVPGLIEVFPTPYRAIAAELTRQPEEQMVLEEVPSWSCPHLESHCLYSGKVIPRTPEARIVRSITFIIFYIYSPPHAPRFSVIKNGLSIYKLRLNIFIQGIKDTFVLYFKRMVPWQKSIISIIESLY